MLSGVYLSNKYRILDGFCLKFSLTKNQTLPAISQLKQSDKSELSPFLLSTGIDFQFQCEALCHSSKALLWV